MIGVQCFHIRAQTPQVLGVMMTCLCLRLGCVWGSPGTWSTGPSLIDLVIASDIDTWEEKKGWRMATNFDKEFRSQSGFRATTASIAKRVMLGWMNYCTTRDNSVMGTSRTSSQIVLFFYDLEKKKSLFSIYPPCNVTSSLMLWIYYWNILPP